MYVIWECTILMISRSNNDITLLCFVAVCHLQLSGVAALFGFQSMYNFSTFPTFWLHKKVYPNSKMLTISRNNNNIMILSCVAVCHLLRSGVAALFGPQSGTTSSHVQSICDAMEIPHIETRWDYRLRRDEYSVNLYPHPSALSKVSPSLHTN